jgi:secreted Zn-dependent insulinase-like peptidase
MNNHSNNIFTFSNHNLYKHSPDSATFNVYFLGPNNIRNIVRMKTIMNIAGNIFFSFLRIKHQLGYSVKNNLINVDNNLIYHVSVQGSKKNPGAVNNYIDKAILKIKEKLAKIDEKTFNNIRVSIGESLNKKSSKLEYKNNYYWGLLLKKESIYSNKELKEYVDSLTINDLIKFIDKLLENKVSIQVKYLYINKKFRFMEKEKI